MKIRTEVHAVLRCADAYQCSVLDLKEGYNYLVEDFGVHKGCLLREAMHVSGSVLIGGDPLGRTAMLVLKIIYYVG